jgi:putative membrane protein
MKNITAILLLVIALAPIVYADDNSPKSVSATPDERETLTVLHVANQKEVKAGGLAIERGQTKGIREFGKMMVEDHTAADDKIVALARKKDVVLAEMESTALDTLRATKDTEFDRTFITMMVKEHEHAIKVVKDAQRKCKDKDILAFLGDTLPTLQKHRDAAERLQNPTRAEASPTKR